MGRTGTKNLLKCLNCLFTNVDLWFRDFIFMDYWISWSYCVNAYDKHWDFSYLFCFELYLPWVFSLLYPLYAILSDLSVTGVCLCVCVCVCVCVYTHRCTNTHSHACIHMLCMNIYINCQWIFYLCLMLVNWFFQLLVWCQTCQVHCMCSFHWLQASDKSHTICWLDVKIYLWKFVFCYSVVLYCVAFLLGLVVHCCICNVLPTFWLRLS